MAIISEFKGLRPKKEFVSRVAVLPYDVVSVDEARKIAADNKICFFHVTKPEIDFPNDIDTQSRDVFQHGKDYLAGMIKDKILIQDEAPCLYLYTQIMDGREQTGLIACVSIDDYHNKIIKKHELTREDKETERTRHTDIINANTGQVFLIYRDSESKKELMKKAMEIPHEYDFPSEDGVRQTVRVIRDKAMIESFKSAFKNDVLYIADGHHRAAAAVRVGMQRRKENPRHTGNEEYNRFMAVIFPHSQLKILAYNRVVRDLNGMTEGQFMHALSEKFKVEKTDRTVPDAVHSICMYLEGSWYLLRPAFEPGNDPINSLDVKLLQDLVLGPILGIKDPRTDKRIDFIGGLNSVAELQKRVDSGTHKVAFSMYPTTLDQLMRVSDTDGIMPPKSTWFEPKLRSGIVVHLL
jgi:uncharacterized protein (DUF1015 family)